MFRVTLISAILSSGPPRRLAEIKKKSALSIHFWQEPGRPGCRPVRIGLLRDKEPHRASDIVGVDNKAEEFTHHPIQKLMASVNPIGVGEGEDGQAGGRPLAANRCLQRVLGLPVTVAGEQEK